MKFNPLAALPAALAILLLGPATPVLASGEGLAVLMERMQTYTHKAQLSVEARNAPLADFYLHELEETAEHIVEHVESYDDYPVGALTREMLLPAIEALEDALEEGDWAETGHRFSALLQSCNDCHVATGHGLIRIVPAAGNPFAQDFAPRAD